jgi:hypothetical protein
MYKMYREINVGQEQIKVFSSIEAAEEWLS